MDVTDLCKLCRTLERKNRALEAERARLVGKESDEKLAIQLNIRRMERVVTDLQHQAEKDVGHLRSNCPGVAITVSVSEPEAQSSGQPVHVPTLSFGAATSS